MSNHKYSTGRGGTPASKNGRQGAALSSGYIVTYSKPFAQRVKKILHGEKPYAKVSEGSQTWLWSIAANVPPTDITNCQCGEIAFLFEGGCPTHSHLDLAWLADDLRADFGIILPKPGKTVLSDAQVDQIINLIECSHRIGKPSPYIATKRYFSDRLSASEDVYPELWIHCTWSERKQHVSRRHGLVRFATPLRSRYKRGSRSKHLSFGWLVSDSDALTQRIKEAFPTAEYSEALPRKRFGTIPGSTEWAIIADVPPIELEYEDADMSLFLRDMSNKEEFFIGGWPHRCSAEEDPEAYWDRALRLDYSQVSALIDLMDSTPAPTQALCNRQAIII